MHWAAGKETPIQWLEPYGASSPHVTASPEQSVWADVVLEHVVWDTGGIYHPTGEEGKGLGISVQ